MPFHTFRVSEWSDLLILRPHEVREGFTKGNVLRDSDLRRLCLELYSLAQQSSLLTPPPALATKLLSTQ